MLQIFTYYIGWGSRHARAPRVRLGGRAGIQMRFFSLEGRAGIGGLPAFCRKSADLRPSTASRVTHEPRTCLRQATDRIARDASCASLPIFVATDRVTTDCIDENRLARHAKAPANTLARVARDEPNANHRAVIRALSILNRDSRALSAPPCAKKFLHVTRRSSCALARASHEKNFSRAATRHRCCEAKSRAKNP